MKRVLMVLPILVLSFAMVANAQLVAPGANSAPKVGEKAPDFELPTGQGTATLGLKDFAGKKKVLLTFFPAAFTGG